MQTVILSCKHTLEYDRYIPELGESLWCSKCSRYRIVETSAVTFNLRCRDCAYSRKSRLTDIAQVRRLASAHAMKRPTHRIDISNGAHHVETVTQDPGQGKLPFRDNAQERIDRANASHRSLRSLVERVTPLPNRDLDDGSKPPY